MTVEGGGIVRALFGGVVVKGLETFGQHVDLSVRLVNEEVERRRDAAMGAVLDASMLRFVSALPYGIRLPVDLLDPLGRLALGEATAAGLIHQAVDEFVVVVRPPVEPIGLVMHALDWDDIVAVSFLRTHAPRAVIVGRPLARRVMNEADPGLGVVSEGEVVRLPDSRYVKSGWQRWLTAELAYARLLAS